MLKKSQIQMMETIIILFIFFILLVFGFVFYAKFFSGSTKMEQKETVQLQAVQIAQRVADLPEIQCTKNNVKVDNCVDMYKLEAAKDIIQTNTIHYFDMFGFSTIKVKVLHPIECNDGVDNDGNGFTDDPDDKCDSPEDASEFQLGDQSEWIIYETDTKKTTSSIFIPTIIYDPAAPNQYCYIGQGSCSIGLIEVNVYS